MTRQLNAAQQQLVVDHMSDAEMIARCMRRGDDDVRSVALLALCEAAMLYEARRSKDFGLFARCHIRNQVIKHIKREKSREHEELDVEPPAPRWIDIEKLALRLPPDDFTIFYKFAVKGLSAKAIANWGGFSLKTAYQRIARAVDHIKDALLEPDR